jgi:hypothetical protein
MARCIAVADRDVGGRHHAFADASAGAQNPVGVQAHTDVAVVGRNPSFLIDQLADIEDVLAMLLLRLGHPGFQLYQSRWGLPTPALYNEGSG